MNRSSLMLSVPVSELLDPDLWRERYAFGIQLTAGGGSAPTSLVSAICRERGDLTLAGWKAAEEELRAEVQEIPDATIRWHLRSAASDAEIKLRQPLGIVRVVSSPGSTGSDSDEELLAAEGLLKGRDYDAIRPRRPYYGNAAADWYRLDLPSQTISIQRVRGFYFGQIVWELSSTRGNINQVRLEAPVQGKARVLPINLSALLLTPGFPGYGVFHTLMFGQHVIPDFWAVDYTMGPIDRHTGEPATVPAVLADWIYATAGIKILSMAGLAKSQGLSSTSTSFDGFSKSVGLQASAIYGLNSALEHVLEEHTKRIDWKRISLWQNGLRVLPYGG